MRTKENKVDLSSHKSQGQGSAGKWQALATRQLARFQGRHAVVGGRVTDLDRVPVGSGGRRKGLGVRPGHQASTLPWVLSSQDRGLAAEGRGGGGVGGVEPSGIPPPKAAPPHSDCP